jgi:hypothetical protein
MQKASGTFFEAVSKYAEDVPIIVIATMKKDFLGAKMLERRDQLRAGGQPVTIEEMESYADNQLQVRLSQIEEEMLSMEGGRFDALVAVDKCECEYNAAPPPSSPPPVA